MTPIQIVAFVWMEPPGHTDTLTYSEPPKNSKFHNVADVADVSVLHLRSNWLRNGGARPIIPLGA
jgi:hypothetical protein